MYNGEADVLSIRLNELDRVVDYFVVAEGDLTFSGQPRRIRYDPSDPRLQRFAAKVRHVIVRDVPTTDDPWVREAWQRNAVLRGVDDAAAEDLLILSDVDEIPRNSIITEIITDQVNDTFGFRLELFYFFVNYLNVGGAESSSVWNNVTTKRCLDSISPQDLRAAVRRGRAPARIFDKAGWHFSYLMDETGIRRKIASFSHQEHNTKEFLDRLNVSQVVRERRDFYDRPGYRWDVVPDHDLPDWLRRNRSSLSHLFWPDGI